MTTAITFHDFTGDGSDKTFDYTFPTYAESEVKVDVEGVTVNNFTIPGYATSGTHTVTFDNTTGTLNTTVCEASGAPKNGLAVRVYRRTDLDTNKATFSAGSAIKADDLNNNNTQVLRAAQEIQTQTTMSVDIKDAAVITSKLATDAVTYAKIQNVSATDRVLGRDSADAGDIEEITPAALRTMINVEDGATADQTNAEIRTAVEAASDSNVFTDADHSKLNAIEASADVTDATNVNAAGAVMNSDTTTAAMQFVVDEDDFSSDLATKVPTQQSTKAYIGTYAEPKDAQLTTLAGMQAGTASILAGSGAADSSTALSANIDELNLLDGKSIVETISASPTHVQLPTAQAVDSRITTVMTDVGGFVPIANETSFPATNPDVNDAAGTLISLKALTSNLVSNGSGVATVTNGAGVGNDVTINGLANSTTYAAGKGLILETTSTLHTYSFHREALSSAQVSTAQTLVSDFGDRYQIAGSAPTAHPDSSALQEGDLWFDTGANTMKVYDGSSYAAVTSVGDYKLLTVVPDGATSGTPDYTNVSFDLRDGGSAASVTSVGQLLVSVNGVLQKPNSTSWSASNEGFHLEGTNGIKFCTAPGAGASVFVTLIGSATSVNVPATNSIVEDAIQTNVVSEGKLKVGNGPTNGKFLQAQSGQTGGLYWETVDLTALSASNLTSGTVPDARFPATLPAVSAANLTSIPAANVTGTLPAIDGSNLTGIEAGAKGGGTNKIFWENEQTIDYNYTITNNHNAFTAGPVSIAATGNGNSSTVVVTIGTGENWTII